MEAHLSGQRLAFDPDHNRHPIPFVPAHRQCLHVMLGLLTQPGHKGDISIELLWAHSPTNLESRVDNPVPSYIHRPYDRADAR